MISFLSRCVLVLFFTAASAFAEKEICIFTAKDGKTYQTNSRSSIPGEYQAKAKCFPAKQVKSNHLAKPKEIELSGSLRRTEMSSSVGRIKLRWPRRVEKLFGTTPERAMAEAARSVSKALKQSGFPSEVKTLDLTWDVVFMDEELPETQIPYYLVSNCHPAWMTPPTNIYVVAQRVVAGCGGSSQSVTGSVADAKLAQILIHELGHAIEYQLLGKSFGGDRRRSEGFASWFEQYASNYSTLVGRGVAERFYKTLARQHIKSYPGKYPFSGSSHDYARSSMDFHAIVKKARVLGLMDVYREIVDSQTTFPKAVEKKIGWSEKRLNEEVKKLLE